MTVVVAVIVAVVLEVTELFVCSRASARLTHKPQVVAFSGMAFGTLSSFKLFRAEVVLALGRGTCHSAAPPFALPPLAACNRACVQLFEFLEHLYATFCIC